MLVETPISRRIITGEGEMTNRRCKGINNRDQPCGVVAPIYSDGFCMWHSADPKATHQLDRMRVRAKRASKGRVVHPDDLPGELETFDDAVRWLAWITKRVATGQISSNAGRVATATVRSFMQAIDKRDVEDKIKQLQALVKKAKQAGAIE